MISSDEYDGRKPGTLGERLTTNYIIEQFKRMGLEPGNKGEWIQTVPAVSTALNGQDTLSLDVAEGGGTEHFPFGSDMVAGTLVIMAPKATLLPDLAGQPTRTSVPLTRESRDQVGPRYTFTPAQLDFYGVYELQTLEAVLRRADAGNLAARQEIARRIRAKIGWPDQSQGGVFWERGFDATAFLEAFYAAQRAQLERRMLFGKRRKDKHDRT